MASPSADLATDAVPAPLASPPPTPARRGSRESQLTDLFFAEGERLEAEVARGELAEGSEVYQAYEPRSSRKLRLVIAASGLAVLLVGTTVVVAGRGGATPVAAIASPVAKPVAAVAPTPVVAIASPLAAPAPARVVAAPAPARPVAVVKPARRAAVDKAAAARTLAAAEQAFRTGDLAGARKKARESLALGAPSARAWHVIAQAYCQSGEQVEARRALARAGDKQCTKYRRR